MIRHKITTSLIACLLYFLSLGVDAQETASCGSLDNAYGPYDYANAQHRRDRLPIVEAGHFNADVENLIRGMTGSVGDDLDYTLRAFPNHARALWAMARLHLRERTKKLPNARYSIDCWFDRAIRMNSTDATTRYVYGMYLHRAGEFEGAMQNYSTSLRLNSNNPELHYNIGLLHLELGNLDEAKDHAVMAYELGFPLPGLRNKLRDHGIEI